MAYDRIGSLQKGFAGVEKNKKYGFIDESGVKVVPLKFDNISWGFVGEACLALYNSHWHFLDKQGCPTERSRYNDSYKNIIATQVGFHVENVCPGKDSILFKNGVEKLYDSIYLEDLEDIEGVCFVQGNNGHDRTYECGYINANGTEYWED